MSNLDLNTRIPGIHIKDTEQLIKAVLPQSTATKKEATGWPTREISPQGSSLDSSTGGFFPPMALSQARRVYLGFVQGCSPGPLRMLLTHPCPHVSPWEISCCDTFQKVSTLMRTASSLQGATVAWWLQPTSITPGRAGLIMPPPRCGTKLINATCIHHCPLHGGLTFQNAQQITPQGPLTPAYSFLPFKRICRVMTDTRSYSPTSLQLHSPIFIPLPSSRGFQKAKLILLHVTGDDSAL